MSKGNQTRGATLQLQRSLSQSSTPVQRRGISQQSQEQQKMNELLEKLLKNFQDEKGKQNKVKKIYKEAIVSYHQ